MKRSKGTVNYQFSVEEIGILIHIVGRHLDPDLLYQKDSDNYELLQRCKEMRESKAPSITYEIIR